MMARMTKASVDLFSRAKEVFYRQEKSGVSIYLLMEDGQKKWIQGAEGILIYPDRFNARRAIKRLRKDLEPVDEREVLR